MAPSDVLLYSYMLVHSHYRFCIFQFLIVFRENKTLSNSLGAEVVP